MCKLLNIADFGLIVVLYVKRRRRKKEEWKKVWDFEHGVENIFRNVSMRYAKNADRDKTI